MAEEKKDLKKKTADKKELFETMPVPRALAKMAIPTIISQIVNLVYNIVDAFFIGRTGNSYMVAATTVALALTMMNVALANLFGVGGGSLIARLMGRRHIDEAKHVSAFSLYACIALALTYALLILAFMEPILFFLGASKVTIIYAKQYTLFVIVLGSPVTITSLTLAHLLRNAGFSSKASIGLSGGGILNMVLDPIFMFVIMPDGYEVAGAAMATFVANTAGLIFLLAAYRKAKQTAPLSMSWADARSVGRGYIKDVLSVGIPSALLTGLFDLASICVNILAAAHSDLVLAGMGIVLKVERIPNAVNIGICQGMMPIIAYNYTSGDHARMKETIRTARLYGLIVSGVSILLLEIFASPVTKVFLSTSTENSRAAIVTVGLAALFLRIRALASPVQFINYHTSFCMQAIGKGSATILHAMVRELVFYIPLMFILDRMFGYIGLASALPAGEALGAVFALVLLRRILKKSQREL